MMDRLLPPIGSMRVAILVLATVIEMTLAASGRADDAHLSPAPTQAIVVRAIDGESVEARIDGRLEVVRYIGIGTPRIDHPVQGPAAYRLEATRANAALVEGQAISLELGMKRRDAAGRLLAFVLAGGRVVNAELVRRGFAEVVTRPPDVARRAELLALQREAQAARRGLWADADALRFYRPAASGVLASRRTMSFFHVDDVLGWLEESREEFDSPEAAARAGYAPSFNYPVHRERDLRAWLLVVDRLDGPRPGATVPLVTVPNATVPLVTVPVPVGSARNIWRGGVITPVP